MAHFSAFPRASSSWLDFHAQLPPKYSRIAPGRRAADPGRILRDAALCVFCVCACVFCVRVFCVCVYAHVCAHARRAAGSGSAHLTCRTLSRVVNTCAALLPSAAVRTSQRRTVRSWEALNSVYGSVAW